jgi:hypothetical protein
MPWSSLTDNQTVSDTNLKDAVDTGVFTAGGTAFPSPTENKGVTKSRCEGFINVQNINNPSFAVKSGNQIITKEDLYSVGDFRLDPQYGKVFTNMTGTNLPSFTFNVTSNTIRQYNNIIPAQNIFVELTGNAVLSPVRVSLYINSVLIQSVAIAQNGATSATLTLPNDVSPTNEIKIAVDSGTVPPSGAFTFGTTPVNCVAVSKTTGQYQIAAIGVWDYNVSGFYRCAKKGGYICYSSDYGATWFKSNVTGNFCKLAISDDGRYALAASQSGFLYRSTNFGATWTAVTSLGQRVWSGADIGANMYVCCRKTNGTTEGKVFKSTNNGGTWTDITPDTNKDYHAIAVWDTKSGSEQIIVGLFMGVGLSYYLSISSGTNWTPYSI